jgi:hypothetical protein
VKFRKSPWSSVSRKGAPQESGEFSNTKDNDWFWRVVLVFITCLMIVGCSLSIPNEIAEDADSKIGTDIATPIAEDVWQALAQAVASKTISNTARLAQYVVVLARNGVLSEQDVAAFDAAFPQIASGSRDLTNLDVKTLLQLGRRAQR